MSAKTRLTIPQVSTGTNASSSAARPASPASSAYAATEPQIIKPGSPRNQESPPDSPQPIDAETQLTIPWVSTTEKTSSKAARPVSLQRVRCGGIEPEPMFHFVDFDFGNVDAAPSLMLPSPETPLYNAFLDK